jgi:vacuolar protein sorting-associated protein 29
VLHIGDLKVGLLHGHQVCPWGDADALAIHARQLDVDVLISGHTHAFTAHEQDGVIFTMFTGVLMKGKFFLNPGSSTGADSLLSSLQPTPSFALMDIQGSSIVTYVYQLIDQEVKVEKVEYRHVKQ